MIHLDPTYIPILLNIKPNKRYRGLTLKKVFVSIYAYGPSMMVKRGSLLLYTAHLYHAHYETIWKRLRLTSPLVVWRNVERDNY